MKEIFLIAILSLSTISYLQLLAGHNLLLDAASVKSRADERLTETDDALKMSPAEIAALVNTCGVQTTQMTRRLYNYTFKETDTEYAVDKKGQVKGEQSKVYEVYPVIIGKRSKWVYVQIAENNVPFSDDKIARERERVTKELTEFEEASAKSSTAAASSPYIPRYSSYGIRVEKHSGLSKTIWFINPTDFFVSHDFYAPRRTTFKGREAILLSFRPRPNYVFDKTNVPYAEGIEDYGRVMAQLGGVVWIDAADKVVMRLEAMPVQELNSLKALPNDAQNAPVGFELMRLPEGTWVPGLSWYNSYGRESVFWKTAISRTRKYGEFKLFKTSADVEKLDSPKPQ